MGILERLFGAKGVGRALVLHLGDRGLDERKRAELAVSTLTPCEKEVLLLLARGWTNVQIAEALHISERTAKFYVHNVTEKLGGPDRKRAPSARSSWASCRTSTKTHLVRIARAFSSLLS